MKNNFTCQFAYCDSAFSAYELQVSMDGSMARVRYSYMTTGGEKRSRARWQQIKYNRAGTPYVTFRGHRLALDNFLRT